MNRVTWNVVALPVDVPDRVLVGGAELPRHLVAAARLLHSDRLPGAELAFGYVRSCVLERQAIEDEGVGVGDVVQCRRSRRFDHRRGDAYRAVTIEILLERRLQRLERVGLARHDRVDFFAVLVAVRFVVSAEGFPDNVLIGGAELPYHHAGDRASASTPIGFQSPNIPSVTTLELY